MIHLAAKLKFFLGQQLTAALGRDPSASVRPVLVGPPVNTLAFLFDLLTSNGSSEWSINGQQIPVLLVGNSSTTVATSEPAISPHLLSKRCLWDYAVTIRNSYPLVVILVDPANWDNRPESLANTTETIGTPGIGHERTWLRGSLWKYLIREISLHTGVHENIIRYLFQQISQQSLEVEPATRDCIPWQIADDLLGPLTHGLSPDNFVAASTGFPSIGTTGVPLKDAVSTSRRLGEFIGEHGLENSQERLAGTSTAQPIAVAQALHALFDHIWGQVISGAEFARAPFWYFRPGLPTPPWWELLDTGQLQHMLDEVGGRPSARVELKCENALNAATQLNGEPWIVATAVELRARAPRGQPVTTPTFSRKVGRSSFVPLAPVPGDELACIDAELVTQEKPIKYQVEAAGLKSSSIDVLVLDGFECRGSAHVRDASRNRPPVRARGQTQWIQEILLPRGGAIDFGVFHSSNVAIVQVEIQTAPTPFRRLTMSGQSLVMFVLEVEDGINATVLLEDTSGAILGQWIVHFAVQDTTDLARSRFDALVSAHQGMGRVGIPRPSYTLAQRIEAAIVASRESWKPILACWPSKVTNIEVLDWSDPRLGATSPQIDPRPELNPPQTLLDARESVREYLQSQLRSVAEIDLADDAFAPLIEQYLEAYSNWLTTSSDQAAWIDCIAVHAAVWNPQAGYHTATSEPVAILLSPVHPVRLAWQCIAQRQLATSLNRRCPAAGLLDPSSCPDIGLWPMSQGGGNFVRRTFLSIACDNPYWAMLWNRNFLGRQPERVSVLERISDIGLESKGIIGGFSRSQALDSLEEVTDLLPGRATLRVGIIGTTESSSACGEGVIDWCVEKFSDESTDKLTPFGVEVYDMRDISQPSPEQLATLSERSQERVKWFKVSNVAPTITQDLVILDQLGAESAMGANGEARATVGPGALYRVRIREDLQNAAWIKESRIGRPGTSTGLLGLLAETTAKFESLSLSDGEISHLQFQPNQQAIGSRLNQSTYLAVTSSQVDPACVIRGATSQEGYLWDYELPGVLGGDEDSAGYYLIAKPSPAMSAAIERSARLVTDSPPPVQGLLNEISRRGIPILKRLAGGGTEARGEIGLLLAVRLLQDAFRQGATVSRLPVWHGECIHLLLPVDPYEEPFERVRKALCPTTTGQRPDLLLMAIYVPVDKSSIQIKITPIEVKFRERLRDVLEQREYLAQASNLGQVLEAMWVAPAQSDLWATCSTALLAQCLDLAFRIYADESVHGHTSLQWAGIQEHILHQISSRQAQVLVNAAGRLLIFDKSSIASSVADLDGDGERDTAIVCGADASVLLSGTGELSPVCSSVAATLGLSLPACNVYSQAADNGSLAAAAAQDVASDLHQPDEVVEKLGPLASGMSPAFTQETLPLSLETLDETHGGGELDEEWKTTILPDLRRRVRDAFEGFIGNESAVKRITNDLLKALLVVPPELSKNYLFTGQPSTGKTELARRMAKTLGLPFIRLDGRGVGSRDRLFELVNGELRQQHLESSHVGTQAGMEVLSYPPLIIFIDEVHLLPRVVQESLLTMLEAADRTVTLAKYVAKMDKATFLFATTRASDIDAAFRSRCVEVQLREYSAAEVAEILRRKFNFDWPQDIYLDIARLGRLVPRVAIEFANELETEIIVSEHPERDISEHLREVRKAREIDNIGLNPIDVAYLSILEREGRPVGEQAILNMLRTVDKTRILDEVEPFLIRLSFIKLGIRGREITTIGRQYILARR